ncbi:MAG: hypothetical protein M3217_08955, partial [Actinomycetota bacterium]|nr:hypothetical protein [Actinomycetota bacterium]
MVLSFYIDVERTSRTLRAAAVAAAVTAALLPAHGGAAASPVPEPPELWVMSSDGTNQRRIAPFADPGSSAPSWSPDGSRLAFTTSEGILIADASGQASPQPIGRGWWPAWSPDGSAIAFVRTAPPERASLAVIAPDGSNERIVATGVASFRLVWSPDGSRIAFSKCDYDAYGRCYPVLAVVRADGTDERVLVPATVSSSVSWSPDGSSLVYAGGFRQLWVVDVVSGETTELVPEPDGGVSPDWGSGGRIAYTGWDDGAGSPSVWLVDADGTDRVRIHTGDGPRWSPDGSRIAFVTPDGIRVLVVGTEGAPVLTPGGYQDFGPVWSPGGESIAYFSQKPFPPHWPDYTRSVSVSVTERRIRVHVDVEPGGEE